ncbi:MAG TPA: hypothetical protein VHJ17_02415 [Thermomonospora sp.]|nr:hypothetical protein [Thermomonospora sp.]
MRYHYLVADLATGNVHDELPLRQVSFSTQLNEAGEFRGTLVLGDPRIGVREPHRVAEPGRTALYVTRDGVPVWGGVVWTVRYASADRTMELGAAGFLSYFDHRRVLPASYDPDVHDLTRVAVRYEGRDQAEIAWDLVATAQAHPDGDLGVRPPPPQDGPRVPRTIAYPGDQLKNVGEALRELAALDDGPDVLFDVETGPGGRIVRRMRVGRPRLGQQGSPHVWEYGANLVEYSWSQDAAGAATRVFALGGQRNDRQLIAVARVPHPAGRPLTETDVSYVETTDPAVLAGHATAALASLRPPVVLLELTVRADRDPVLGSYRLGDDALVVIRDHCFPDGARLPVRLVGMEVTPGDDAGEETVRLTVSPTAKDVP